MAIWKYMYRLISFFQSRVGRVLEQPDLAKDVPARSKELDEMIIKGLFQPKPWYDYIILVSVIYEDDYSFSLSFSDFHFFEKSKILLFYFLTCKWLSTNSLSCKG